MVVKGLNCGKEDKVGVDNRPCFRLSYETADPDSNPITTKI